MSGTVIPLTQPKKAWVLFSSERRLYLKRIADDRWEWVPTEDLATVFTDQAVAGDWALNTGCSLVEFAPAAGRPAV